MFHLLCQGGSPVMHYYCACLCVCVCSHACTHIDRLLKDTWQVVSLLLFTAPVASPGRQAPPRALGLDQMCPVSPQSLLLWEGAGQSHGDAGSLWLLTFCNSSHFWVEHRFTQHFFQQSHVKERKQMLLSALFLHWRPSKVKDVCKFKQQGRNPASASSDGRAMTTCPLTSSLTWGESLNAQVLHC